MTKVFISYSRKDKSFAERLNIALKEMGLDSWIDWDDIPPTSDWWDQIQKGIETADGFLFLLSPDSVQSKVCGEEIDHALKNGKRLIPLVVRDVRPNDVHESLQKLNWIFFRETDDFKTSIKKLEAGIKTDLAWVESHRRLQVRALEWEQRRDRSLLLRGKDLGAAEVQLASAGQKDPQPTDLQRQYVLESRRGESQTRNTLLSIGGVVLVLLALLSVFALNQRNLANDNALTAVANQQVAETAQVDAVEKQALADSNAVTAISNEEEAIKQAKIARARELAAAAVFFREENFPTSLLLGIEAYKVTDGSFASVQAQAALVDNIQFNTHLDQFLFGHTGSVTSVAFSPVNNILASSSSDASIILWDIETGQPIGQPLRGHAGTIHSVAFSPDGQTLVSGGDDNSVIFWDVQTHQPIGQPLAEHTSAVNSIAFSPDGTIVASGGGDGVIYWNAETHEPIDPPQGGPYVSKLVFSPDGKTLASHGVDISLWSVKTHQLIADLPSRYEEVVENVAFSPDGRTLAAAGTEGIVLWDLRTRRRAESLPSGIVATQMAYSPDGKILALDTFQGITFWDAEYSRFTGQTFSGQRGTPSSLTFSPDGKTLASASSDTAILLWSMEEVHPLAHRIPGKLSSVSGLSFSPDGKTLASSGYQYSSSGTYDFTSMLWDVQSPKVVSQHPGADTIHFQSAAFSPVGKILATGNQDHTIILWNMESSQPIRAPLVGHLDEVTTVAFSSDGKILASGSADKTIILWNVETGQPIGQPLKGHTETIQNVRFGPDGKVLVSSSGGNILWWDLETREPIGAALGEQVTGVKSMAFSPDFGMLAFTSCGESLYLNCVPGAIILWDMKTRQLDGPTLTNNGFSAYSLDFSPDGKTLVAGGPDSTLVLWDTETRQPIGQPLHGPSSQIVVSMTFDPYNNMLATGGSDGNLLLWDMNPESWVEIACQRAGRNLTRIEWAQFFPDDEYRKTCEQWPLEPEPTPTQ